MDIIFFIIVWLGLAIATGFAASYRGRSPAGWFFLAMVISPLLALILLIAFPPRRARPSKQCKFCQSEIDRDATVCPHCLRDITPTPAEIELQQAEIEQQNAKALYNRRQSWIAVGILSAVIAYLIVMR
jgi:hypothetical protein